jgi:hypothetical protein
MASIGFALLHVCRISHVFDDDATNVVGNEHYGAALAGDDSALDYRRQAKGTFLPHWKFDARH